MANTKKIEIVPAQPGFFYVWMWLRDGVKLASAQIGDVEMGKEPVVAWKIVADLDEDGALDHGTYVEPIIPAGGKPVSGMVMIPDGRLVMFDSGPMIVEEAAGRWLERQREKAQPA